jgi:hypothetical protein
MPDLDSIRKRMSNAMPTPTIQSLQQIQKDLDPHVSDMNTVKENFAILVDTYYTANHPFNRCRTVSEGLGNLIQIIGLATSAESLQLVDKWGVEAFRTSLPRESVNEIIEVFSKNYASLKPGTRRYSEYLIAKIRG